MKFPHLLPVIVKYLNRKWADFMSPSLQLFPIHPEEAIQKALAEMNLVEDTRKAAYVYSILSQFTFPSLTYDERWTVERIAEIAQMPMFIERYLELKRIPALNEFFKFPHMLPKLAAVLNEEWPHFFDLCNMLPNAKRLEGAKAVFKKLAVADEMERMYVGYILQDFNYQSPVHDEFMIVSMLADIAGEPDFYEKYTGLNPTLIVDSLSLSSPVLPPRSPLIRQKRKSSDEAGEMDAVTAVATQDFLASQSKVLRTIDSARPIASGLLNVAAAIPVENFQLNRKAFTRALKVGISQKIIINQLIDSVPTQFIWNLLEEAKTYIRRSLKRTRVMDREACQ